MVRCSWTLADPKGLLSSRVGFDSRRHPSLHQQGCSYSCQPRLRSYFGCTRLRIFEIFLPLPRIYPARNRSQLPGRWRCCCDCRFHRIAKDLCSNSRRCLARSWWQVRCSSAGRSTFHLGKRRKSRPCPPTAHLRCKSARTAWRLAHKLQRSHCPQRTSGLRSLPRGPSPGDSCGGHVAHRKATHIPRARAFDALGIGCRVAYWKAMSP